MIRMERAIRHVARERDWYLLRLELCDSERREPADEHLRVEVAIPARCYREVLRLIERWKKRGDL